MMIFIPTPENFVVGGGLHSLFLFMIASYTMKRLSQNNIIPAYKDIFSFANLFSAWREFQNGKRNKKDVAEFSANVIHNLSVLESDLLSENYLHGGYFHFKVSDPKPRDIHKASVRDRIVHHAIHRALYPYFDNKFIYDSYSCRINKGTHRAIRGFENYIRKVGKNNTKTCWVLKCDIRKFFANIDHTILKRNLEKHIKDERIIRLLSQIIDSFYSNYKNGIDRTKGLPLGNLTSQLLVNIYMNKFDHFIKRELKVKYYIRYSDDFVILNEDKKQLESSLLCMRVWLEKELKLEMHPCKVFIKTLASGIDFLGWIHFPNHRVLRTATKRRMFRNIKLKEGKTETVQSYLGMLKHGNTFKLRNEVKNSECLGFAS